MRIPRVLAVVVSASLLVISQPALAQWFEEDEPRSTEKLIVNPFTFKGFNMGSGGQVSAWIAPGSDPKVTSLSFLLRGGYKFEDTPVYIGLEVPLTYASADPESKFAIGNIGLGIKGRMDPSIPNVDIFTGWSLDVYLPTAWTDSAVTSMALGLGGLSSLLPGIFNPESISVAGSFDLVLPGEMIYFQGELTVAAFFPAADTKTRDVEGGLLWGGVLGAHLADPVALLLELKGYTSFNQETSKGTWFALSSGFRFEFGAFKPGLWLSFPLNQEYRDAYPNVIIGLDLAGWF